MSHDPLITALAALPRIGTEDRISHGSIPDGLGAKYQIKSYRNAANLLVSTHSDLIAQLFGVLGGFEIEMEDILAPGGNKSRIAKKLEGLLHPLGWYETRISGDLIVRRSSKTLNTRNKKSKFDKVEETSVLENFLDGHQIDFVKGRIAFDLEWNSKDQTFDRDLYAMRAFYDAGIIDVGIILTRSTNLSAMLADIAGRLDALKKFKEKYGASTTWMGKLDYRINAGRAGGCPILALGFEEAVFSELEDWRTSHPVIDSKATAEALMQGESED